MQMAAEPRHVYLSPTCLIYWSVQRQGPNILYLSYHRCYIWQKLACRVYYSYLRQAIHGRVTSEVNIAKMQMAAIFFSRFKSLADEWRCLAAYMFLIIAVLSLNLHCLYNKGIISSQLLVYRLFRTFTFWFYLYRENQSSPESAWPLQQYKNTVRCIFSPGSFVKIF